MAYVLMGALVAGIILVFGTVLIAIIVLLGRRARRGRREGRYTSRRGNSDSNFSGFGGM
jgi:hypothetical protein